MLRPALAATAALALFGAGYLAGQAQQSPPATAAPAAQLGTTYCAYKLETEYFPGGGSYTVLSAVIAEWSSLSRRWESVSSYTARYAVRYDCEREY